MPQVSSLRERRRDRSATRVAVTITGDVSPAERVDALGYRCAPQQEQRFTHP